ncbi:MAG TPA: zinc-binding dehydrogenase [Myxococcales bacterium]|jgi:NADPH:quinone reductase-like Zn-dependent oxidoreductase|nr:zinc-binding dehydrogenase [Myxococcales bacterium]
MKAVVIERHGGGEVLQLRDLSLPALRPSLVRVRVKAVALNHLDLWVRGGLPGLKVAFPHRLGSDVAGVVEEVGSDVQGVEAGSAIVVNPGLSCGRCRECLSGRDNFCRAYAILGEHVSGGYGELLDVPAQNLCPKPAKLSFEEAACIPLTFLTAWQMLVERAALRPGETLLVQAAGSGVGAAAVQIGKLLGARVLATAGSDDKLARARSLGADEILNYEKEDFAKAARALTGKRGVDVVFEHVGEKTWSGSLVALAPGGRLVTCGATTGHDARVDLRHLFAKQYSLLGSTMGSKGALFDILAHVDSGRLRPVLDRVLPLEKAADAHHLLEDRAQFGKIVLVP